MVLVSAHRNPWYEYAAVAAAGSVIGAYLTYRLARKAGHAYLENNFGKTRVTAFLSLFNRNADMALIVSSTVPLPFPTSMVFAAAGASNYPCGKYLPVVFLSRAARYTAIALLAERYGRHVAPVFLHPGQYWYWLLFLCAAVALLVWGGYALNRRFLSPQHPAHAR